MSGESVAFAPETTMPAALTRTQVVDFVRRRAIPATRARIEMSFILLVTTVTGFLASLGLLAAGLDRMPVRYPLVVALAYGVFLLQLGLWLRLRLGRDRSAARRVRDDPSASFDLGGFEHGGSRSSWEPPFRGGGGRFGGGGAVGSWREADAVPGFTTGSGASPSPVGLTSRSESVVGGAARPRGGGGWGGAAGDDEGSLVAIVAFALLVLVVAAVFALAVFWAPALFAEILADGLIAGGLYRGVRGLEATHWLRSALRRTLLPMLAVMVLACLVGVLVERAIPEAHWIGDVIVRGFDRQ